jgi:hypothetical protein
VARVLLVALALALSGGCADGGDDGAPATTCDDATFRAQDEELYVTKAAVSNAISGGGSPEVLRSDLERAHAALSAYLDAHPPCDGALLETAARERGALAAVGEAISELGEGGDPVPKLRTALTDLTSAQDTLLATP